MVAIELSRNRRPRGIRRLGTHFAPTSQARNGAAPVSDRSVIEGLRRYVQELGVDSHGGCLLEYGKAGELRDVVVTVRTRVTLGPCGPLERGLTAYEHIHKAADMIVEFLTKNNVDTRDLSVSVKFSGTRQPYPSVQRQ